MPKQGSALRNSISVLLDLAHIHAPYLPNLGIESLKIELEQGLNFRVLYFQGSGEMSLAIYSIAGHVHRAARSLGS